ncbi:DUF4249 domain-containing protein [Hymenobacter lucidus]|uniref:DUF4249 domain-containing protein n=1 Tax=Hymenobacter lucidus TaxID=2880930 RepID=A0ABS8ARM9_9BACT|nr:DUF4249 domain-containing protein [Hymenobacter lucidus]MCB2407361.1 DUF4249 domain-containing protein [Hymenobacter lucidus]
MKYLLNSFCYAFLVVLLSSCIDSYAPDVIEHPESFLVVDGFINSRGVTTIRLSRTVSLQNNGTIPVETKAVLYLEDEAGLRYPLVEGKAGTYQSAALTLSTAKKVRLRIKTAAQKDYASDYATVKVTPPIDAVNWRVQDGGVQVFVNAHDDTKQSRYYRWEYEETWEFTSAYRSYLEFKDGKMQPRRDDIYHCWSSENPTVIKLGNTVKLAQDIVSDFPLRLLPSNSVKLRYRYSMLVKQYVQTPDEYAYWEALRKNTESIGTLFDALPTQLTGNVHSLSDASEVVIGFVGAHSMTQKRLFIHYTELPRDWKYETGYEKCMVLDTIPKPGEPSSVNVLSYFLDNLYVPVDQVVEAPQLTYVASSADCIDCRKRGTNVKPEFWP